MEHWAAEMRARLGDKIEIQTFPGGTLLDAKNMVRGVMQGQADIGCISLAYHPGAYPLLSAFELPLGFDSAQAASAVLWDLHQKYQPAETSKVKVIALFTSAPSQIMSTKPLKSVADIKGLTLRSAGVLADVAESMGARPVSMPQSDAPEALQKGMVQGVFSSMDVLKDYNFAESCRHGLIVNSSLYPFMVFMNMKKWTSLPADVQQTIMDMGREHSVWTGVYVDEHGREARAWAKETYGAVLNELSGEELAALRSMSAPVLDAWKK
jgi:TRAP-type C4-dicarboxylate transport system substrate-binding protein